MTHSGKRSTPPLAPQSCDSSIWCYKLTDGASGKNVSLHSLSFLRVCQYFINLRLIVVFSYKNKRIFCCIFHSQIPVSIVTNKRFLCNLFISRSSKPLKMRLILYSMMNGFRSLWMNPLKTEKLCARPRSKYWNVL